MFPGMPRLTSEALMVSEPPYLSLSILNVQFQASDYQQPLAKL